MKHLFSSLSLVSLKDTFHRIMRRFPLPVILSLIITGIIVFLIASNTQNDYIATILVKIVISLSVVFFLSVGISLFCESDKKIDNFKKMLFQWAVLIFWVLFYLNMNTDIDNFETIIYVILTLVWTASLILFSPFISHFWLDKKYKNYFEYFYKISVVFLFTWIVAIVLTLLWNGAILAVETLFDINYSSSWDIYGYWTTLALALFTPLFFLSEIPEQDFFKQKNHEESLFFSFLIRFIAIPFIYIYFCILYTYSVRLLLSFGDWPKWEISWLVIAFSIFWYLCYIFSYNFEVHKSGHNAIVFFRKYFPYAVIPQIAILFYAIWLRIHQYDLTINRYFVVVFWLWLLGISLYFIISKPKSLIYIPASLTAIIVLISIGPWSVYNLPLERQLSRLENNLMQANILQNWEITPLENYSDIDDELSRQIYDGIEYICRFQTCSSLRDIFPTIMEEIETKDFNDYQNATWDYQYYSHITLKNPEQIKKEYSGVSDWKYIQKISDTIKVRSYNPNNNNDLEFIEVNRSTPYDLFPLNISWYEEMYDIDPSSSTSLKIDMREEKLIFSWENNQEIDSVNISELFTRLRAWWTSDWELLFEFSSDIRNYKILVNYGRIPLEKVPSDYDGEYTDFWYFSWYVLVGNK